MERLDKLLRLPAGERWLLVRAALLLVAMRLGLWLLPFQTLRRLLATFTATRTRARDAEPYSKEQVAWAVEAVARRMPLASTCLTRAMAAQVLLARRGYPTLLRIGVVREGKDELQAHAWVESQDEVVIGGYDLKRYTPLATLRLSKR
jgi:hypothetical protein